MEHSLIYITAGDKAEAEALGRAMVEARLAACANVLQEITPIYWWQGKVEVGAEAALIAKTRTALVDELVAFVKARHSYECPCIVALPIAAGNPSFLEWIVEETRAPRPPG